MPSTQNDTVKLVTSLFQFAEAGMKQRRDQWIKNYQYWSATNTIKRPSHKDNVRVPLVFMITDNIQAILTDNNPKCKFLPQEENDIKTADQLDQIFTDYYWDELRLTRTSEEMIWWAGNISGSSIARFGFNMSDGKMYVDTCNSFACFPDPSAKSLETCEFFDYLSVWSLADLRRAYPVQAKNIKADNKLMNYINPVELHSPWKQGSISNSGVLEVFKDSKFKQDFGRVFVHEMWMKSDEMVPIPFDISETDEEARQILDIIGQAANGQIPPEAIQPPEVLPTDNNPEHLKAHSVTANYWQTSGEVAPEALELLLAHMRMHGDEPQNTKTLKYPQGKIITCTDSVLLDEMAAPFGLPYVKLDFIVDPTDFWGKTMQEYIQTLQDSVERRKRQVSDASDKAANPTRFFDINAGWEPNNSKNNAGEQIPVDGDPHRIVYTEPPPSVPNYVPMDAGDSERLAHEIMGTPDVLRGVEPRNDMSGKAIKSLQEALGPRMRKISRHYEQFIVDLFRNLIKLLRYEEPTKIFTILGKKEEAEYVKLTDLSLDSEYHIRITAGSTLPTSRSEKFERALQLAQVQITPDSIVDRPTVLKYLDMPDRDDIVQRMDKEQQYVQYIQQLEQQNQELQELAEDATEEYKKQLEENERLKIQQKVEREARSKRNKQAA